MITSSITFKKELVVLDYLSTLFLRAVRIGILVLFLMCVGFAVYSGIHTANTNALSQLRQTDTAYIHYLFAQKQTTSLPLKEQKGIQVGRTIIPERYTHL